MDEIDSFLKLQALKKFIEVQALDEGVWFDACYATEAYLQKQLRLLSFMIEESTFADINLQTKAYFKEINE